MNLISTVDSKGKVTIPIHIRKSLGIKQQTKMHLSVKENEIVLKKIPDLSDLIGVIKTDKKLTEEDYRKTVRDAVTKKYAQKLKDEEELS